LVTVLVVVFGVISTTSLRQELFPSLDVPMVTVVTAYPGASPEVVEQQVTSPIEAAIGGITGVTGTHSTSTGDSSIITLDLEYGSDLTELTSQCQRAVQGLSLPAGVSPKVITGSTDSLPVALLAVSSNLGEDRVAAVLRDQVRPMLSGLDGVADVTLSGIRNPQITIDVDTKAAASHGVSLSSVVTLLQANGVRVPAGQLTPDTNPLTVEVGSPITTIEMLKDLYLPSVTAASPLTGRNGGAAATTPGRVQPALLLDTARPAVTPTPTVTVSPSSTVVPSPAVTPKRTASVSPSPMVTPTPTPRATPTPKALAGGSVTPQRSLPRRGGAPTIPPRARFSLPPR
jgi:HAE1 family hydrophobic/amphiphilic exporter-1